MLEPAEEGDMSGAGLDGKVVECIAVVSSVRTKVTRSNNLLAFAVIEDLYGTIEVMLFPKVYEKYSALLKPEAILRFRGRISAKEDEMPKLLADQILQVDNESAPCTVFIRINDHNSDFAGPLDSALERYPGKDSVILFFPALNGGSKKTLTQRIDYKKAEQELFEAFGAENVKIK
jgi:DNA polymerase-3 subunit alpha